MGQGCVGFGVKGNTLMCFNIVSCVLTVERGVMYCENALGSGRHRTRMGGVGGRHARALLLFCL